MLSHLRTPRRLSQAILLALALTSQAQTTHEVSGVVRDPLGAVVVSAQVDLLRNGQVVATTRTNSAGEYHLPAQAPAQAQDAIRASAPTFVATVVALGQADHADITLRTPTATETVTVTATGTPIPLAQIASPVTVLTADQFSHDLDIQQPLRLVPGVQITQTGEEGGTTGMYIRGGDTDYNKVLIDGIPADDIGGNVELANISSTGIAKVEVLREPNSALYGSDALAGVVSLTTRRGTTPLPLLEYSAEGGNFGTYRQEGILSGAVRGLDYLSDFARLDTGNSIAASAFHDATFAGNLGYKPNATTAIRFTLRHVNTAGGDANATELYGIPDSAGVQEQDQYYGAVLDSQTTNRWHNELRYGGLRLNYQYADYAPTGIPQYDPTYGTLDDYLGAPVTIHGANGYTVSGQAIFQYPNVYPNFTDNHSARDFMEARTDYRLPALGKLSLLAVGGFRYEDERGSTASTGYTASAIERANYSYRMEIEGDIAHRAYFTLGSGIEDNALFGIAATPRASLGYYLVRPGAASILSGTKLHASFSKGIKEPSVYQQINSLYGLLEAVPGGTSLIQQYAVQQPGAESSRTYDGGIDQELASGRARIGLTYFHNQFNGGMEFLSQSALASFGVPSAGLPEFEFGAYVNSLAYRAQGLEAEGETKLSSHLFARAGYTLLDAKVQQSFSSSALAPAYNTSFNFSNTPIGAYGPLIGARPFRRARNSGYFSLAYTRSRWTSSLISTLVGARDDSDFLTDANYGNSLLLPNHNLDGAYQRLDATGSYRVSNHLMAYAQVQNLLSEHYSEAFGFPSLPLNFRAGIRLSLGGETWKLR
jgi:vitamin B12 transporter